MSASGEAASEPTEVPQLSELTELKEVTELKELAEQKELKEGETTDSSCQDHGDAPSDYERSTKTLQELEVKLRELQDMQIATAEKNSALQEEIQQLREKREADKQKYQSLFLGHEKYARMRSEYKEMCKFIKAHKEEVEAAKAKLEKKDEEECSSAPPPQSPPAPPPSPRQEPSSQALEPASMKRHAIRGEPCLTLTRSEVCRLEQDVLGLRDLLSRREESWRRAKARELEARKKIATLSTELATVRQLAQMRRNQSDELAHRLQEALLELKKHKVENDKLRNNVVRLRNRERSLLVSLSKRCKKASAKADRKKGRQQQRRKSAKSPPTQGSVISSPESRGKATPKGMLRVQFSPPTRS